MGYLRLSVLGQRPKLSAFKTARSEGKLKVLGGANASFLQQFTSIFYRQQLWRVFMLIARRPLRRACLYCGLLFSLILPALGAEKSRVKAEDYVIDAEIVPRTHHLSARAKVKFAALDETNFGTFELNNGLRVTRVTDGTGRALTAERVSQDNAVRVAFPNGMARGATGTLVFDYDGTLSTADDSPVEGLKLAHIGDDYTYLVYPGRC